MNIVVPISLFGWVPVVLGLFWLLPPRRAVVVAFLVAWLFLPMGGYAIAGLPNYSKMSATCLGVVLGVLIYDSGRLLSFRPRWADLPAVVWCLCPFASSVTNGLGVYDGVSAVVNQTITWGLPYVIGRLYFADVAALRELAIAILIGGLIYVPFCLYEIRMSPQLHTMVYGYHQHQFAQSIRFGGYRPTVFMQHGLAVGMWMAMASLVGVWLWRCAALRQLWGVPMSWMVPVLFVTTVLCKSAGALSLLAGGLAVLFVSRWTRTTFPLLCLVMAAPLYMGLRVSGYWTGDGLVAVSSSVMNKERAGSLKYRMENEDMLAAKAMQQPLFGWGGWGRARVYDEKGGDLSVTDGLWVIALGSHGLVGLVSLTGMLLLPGFLLWRRYPPAQWATPALASMAALAVVTTLYMIDNLPNGMVNPIFTVAAAGMTGTLAAASAGRVSSCGDQRRGDGMTMRHARECSARQHS